jgi:hypothetical protein
MGRLRDGQNKNTPLGLLLKNIKKRFNGHYGVKLTPVKFRTFCEIDRPALGVEWPSEGSETIEFLRLLYGILETQISFFILIAGRVKSSVGPYG